MTSHPLRRLVPLALAAVLISGSGSALAQPATVDGDLADLIGYAQQSQSDPLSDVTDALVSGWDFTDVHVYYYPKMDTLYIGLDLQENGDFPGCPGDADGDSNPNDRTRLDVPEDQFGVGADEAYIFDVDTDLNGSNEDFADLVVQYRNNQLRLFRGDGSPVPPSVTGEIVLGVKGALLDPGMPNSNRETEDIELAIRNYSHVDFAACDFTLTVFAGSLVDALKEDILDVPLAFHYPEEVEFRTDIVDGEGGVFDGTCWNVAAGSHHLVQATITNTGTNTLSPIWINFHFPNGVEYLNDSVDGAIQGRSMPIGGGTLQRFVRPGFDNTLDPGETETITFVIRVNFPADPLIVRGYAEGVLTSDKRLCIFSCIGTICLTEAD
jgi:hypothetical protein